MSETVHDVKESVGEDVHPSCQDDEIRSTIDHLTSDFGIVVFSFRSKIPVEEGFESADGGGDRWFVSRCSSEAVSI